MGALATAFSGLASGAKLGAAVGGKPGKAGGQGVTGFKGKGPGLSGLVQQLQKKTGQQPGVPPAMAQGMGLAQPVAPVSPRPLTPGSAMGAAPGNFPQQMLGAPQTIGNQNTGG